MAGKLSPSTTRLIERSQVLLADHGVMTLRHLFYLLISEHVVQNSEKDYRNLVRVIAQARRRGEISYSDIVDGTRGTIKPSSWTGLAEIHNPLPWPNPNKGSYLTKLSGLG